MRGNGRTLVSRPVWWAQGGRAFWSFCLSRQHCTRQWMQLPTALLLQFWKGEKGVSLHSPELTLDGFEWVMLLLLFQISNLATPSNSPIDCLEGGTRFFFFASFWLLRCSSMSANFFSGVHSHQMGFLYLTPLPGSRDWCDCVNTEGRREIGSCEIGYVTNFFLLFG